MFQDANLALNFHFATHFQFPDKGRLLVGQFEFKESLFDFLYELFSFALRLRRLLTAQGLTHLQT